MVSSRRLHPIQHLEFRDEAAFQAWLQDRLCNHREAFIKSHLHYSKEKRTERYACRRYVARFEFLF